MVVIYHDTVIPTYRKTVIPRYRFTLNDTAIPPGHIYIGIRNNDNSKGNGNVW